jgi:flagellar basal body-associated protein FliL
MSKKQKKAFWTMLGTVLVVLIETGSVTFWMMKMTHDGPDS